MIIHSNSNRIKSNADQLLTFDFQNLIDSTFQTKGLTPARALSQFSSKFHSYLRNSLSLVQKYVNNSITSNSNTQILSTFTALGQIGTDEVSNDILLNVIDELVLDPSKVILKLNAMCILYHHLFGNLDQKLFTSVIDNNTKVGIFFSLFYCFVQITGNINIHFRYRALFW